MSPEPTGKEQRREPRIEVRMRIVLVLGTRELVVHTEDISLRGIRVRSDLKLPPRQLLKMRLPIGDKGAELACQGMVVHSHTSKKDNAPSIGIQFYALDGVVRDAWVKLIASLKTPAAKPAAVTPPPIPSGEPIRRQHPRKPLRVTVYIGSMDDLITFTTVNVSRGGMFLATNTPLPIGAKLRLEMKSPDTNPFSVEAVVRRVAMDSDPPGVGVEFVSESGGLKLEELFDDVIKEEAKEPEEEPVFVTSFDPNLE